MPVLVLALALLVSPRAEAGPRDVRQAEELMEEGQHEQAETFIEQALRRQQDVDSLRAVEKCKQHPGKMWIVRGKRMVPLLPLGPADQPWHSSQYQALPEVYVQNASLEIAWARVVFEGRTIAGEVLTPFFTNGYEGFDINGPHDWRLATELVASGEASLVRIPQDPFEGSRILTGEENPFELPG